MDHRRPESPLGKPTATDVTALDAAGDLTIFEAVRADRVGVSEGIIAPELSRQRLSGAPSNDSPR
jgi:hypothetical protein